MTNLSNIKFSKIKHMKLFSGSCERAKIKGLVSITTFIRRNKGDSWTLKFC